MPGETEASHCSPSATCRYKILTQIYLPLPRSVLPPLAVVSCVMDSLLTRSFDLKMFTARNLIGTNLSVFQQ